MIYLGLLTEAENANQGLSHSVIATRAAQGRGSCRAALQGRLGGVRCPPSPGPGGLVRAPLRSAGRAARPAAAGAGRDLGTRLWNCSLNTA